MQEVGGPTEVSNKGRTYSPWFGDLHDCSELGKEMWTPRKGGSSGRPDPKCMQPITTGQVEHTGVCELVFRDVQSCDQRAANVPVRWAAFPVSGIPNMRTRVVFQATLAGLPGRLLRV